MKKTISPEGTRWDELRVEIFTNEELKESEAYVEFLGKLLNIRDLDGITQRELSERAGVTQALISNIETGKQEPKLKTVMRMLDSMGYELDIVPIGQQTKPTV